tara:strand:+ start:1229 stop:1723 length:495 start_codon:yes stop_codon:yes gene_type:complete
MGGLMKENFQYKKIKNFLVKEEIDLLKNYMIQKHRNNQNDFDFLKSKRGESCFYKDPIIDSLVTCKHKKIEQETSLKLFPTHSFCKIYNFGSVLEDHNDKEFCEINLTVHLGSDGTSWPIYIGKNFIELEEGDACMYLGSETPYKKEKFEGDWYAQIFLHYSKQ